MHVHLQKILDNSVSATWKVISNLSDGHISTARESTSICLIVLHWALWKLTGSLSDEHISAVRSLLTGSLSDEHIFIE
jgi:hypothetical protein